MSDSTVTFSERWAIAATIDSQLADDTAVTSDWVNLAAGERVAFIINVGATDTTFDAKLQEATDSSGTSAADITGKAITQITGTDDNKQFVIEVTADELTTDKTHVALVATAGDGTTGVQVAAFGLLGECRYGPASDNDLASVAQIVTA